VFLRGVLGMFDGVQLVAVREMGVVARLLVVAGLGVRCCLTVMLGSVLVMFGGFVMMVMYLVLGHVPISLAGVS
jgi:hypothetical protein